MGNSEGVREGGGECGQNGDGNGVKSNLPKIVNPDVPGNNGSIRTYLVLLQDCLAIKFVSISQLERRQLEKWHQQQQQNSNCRGEHDHDQFSQCCGSPNQCHNDKGASANKFPNDKQSDYEIIGCSGPRCHSRCSSGLGESEKGNSPHVFRGSPMYSNDVNTLCRGGKPIPSAPNNENLSMLNKVDDSMQALFLYKEFREINLHCFWNSTVHEAFSHLEYKGSILPSTIIVGSPIRKYLTILKTAWSRKMLRSPAGYLIDFLGEIEEMIADPIAKSHFVPLSDSLCWAIHELTSSGEEAFVDDISLRLATAFPGMALPTKELIYQTLERLTREMKIYQTAQGYFVVTPDTHRYISSTEPLLMMRSTSQLNNAEHFMRRNNEAFLRPIPALPPNTDEVIVGQQNAKKEDDSKMQKDQSRNAPSPDLSLPYGTFRRYNSLRIKKGGGSGTSTGCLPRRTLSMRLSKSKSKQKLATIAASDHGGGDEPASKPRADVMDSFQNLDLSLNEQLQSRRRKHKSFLSRLLSFRGGRKSSRKERAGRAVPNNKLQTLAIPTKDEAIPQKLPISSNNAGGNDDRGGGGGDGGKESGNDDDTKVEANYATISTQTNLSIENLNEDLSLLALVPTPQPPRKSASSTLERDKDSDSGRCTDSHSDADAEITAALNRGRFTPTMTPDNGHHHHHHTNNVYEKIETNLGLKVDVGEGCRGRSPRSPSSSQMSVSPSPSSYTAITPGRLGANGYPQSRCHSSASSSGYSYRDFYNLYRRRYYPNYYQQPASTTPTPTSPTSLESTAELNELGGTGKPIKPIMRYPPRSVERKLIFDEVTGRSSFREKKGQRSQSQYKSVSIGEQPPNPGKVSPRPQAKSIVTGIKNNNDNNGIHSTTTTTSTLTSGPNSSTTFLTQTLKNTTNMELEFRLPLGSILSATMGGGNLSSTMNMNASSSTSPSSSGKQQDVHDDPTTSRHEHGESPKTKPSTADDQGEPRHNPRAAAAPISNNEMNDINAMVNDLFTIKSFVKSDPFSDSELSSTIEFRRRGEPNSSKDSNDNVNNGNGNNHKDRRQQPRQSQHQHQRYVIEAVSSKPYTDVQSKFNRESEII